MHIALAEMRRRKGRWATIVGAVAFIVFLVLVLAALADGLFIGSTGALRTGDSDALALEPRLKGEHVTTQSGGC